MIPIGYACLIKTLNLNVLPLARPAFANSSVNRRVDSDIRILFPSRVTVDNTLVGHLEFALRHEGVNLEVIDAVFEHLPPGELITRLQATPSGLLPLGVADWQSLECRRSSPRPLRRPFS